MLWNKSYFHRGYKVQVLLKLFRFNFVVIAEAVCGEVGL